MSNITVSPTAAAALKSSVDALAKVVTEILNPKRVVCIETTFSVRASGVPKYATTGQIEAQFKSGLASIRAKALAEFNMLGRQYGVTFSDMTVDDVDAEDC